MKFTRQEELSQAHNRMPFACVYCCILKLCVSVQVCVLCSWRNSLQKSKAKFLSLVPETSDRLVRKSDDSNKMGEGCIPEILLLIQ